MQVFMLVSAALNGRQLDSTIVGQVETQGVDAGQNYSLLFNNGDFQLQPGQALYLVGGRASIDQILRYNAPRNGFATITSADGSELVLCGLKVKPNKTERARG